MNTDIQNKFKPQRNVKLLTYEDIGRIMSDTPSKLLAFSNNPEFPEGSYVISTVVATQMVLYNKFQALHQDKWYPYATTVEEVSLPEAKANERDENRKWIVEHLDNSKEDAANKQRKHTDPLERAIKEDMAFEKAAKDHRKNREDDREALLLNELHQTLLRVNEICEKFKND